MARAKFSESRESKIEDDIMDAEIKLSSIETDREALVGMRQVRVWQELDGEFPQSESRVPHFDHELALLAEEEALVKCDLRTLKAKQQKVETAAQLTNFWKQTMGNRPAREWFVNNKRFLNKEDARKEQALLDAKNAEVQAQRDRDKKAILDGCKPITYVREI